MPHPGNMALLRVFFSTMVSDPLIRNLNTALLPGRLALGGRTFRFLAFLFLLWNLPLELFLQPWFLQQGIQKINLLHSAKFVQIRQLIQLIYFYLYTSHKNYTVVTLLLVLLLSMINCCFFKMSTNSTF